MLSVRLAANLIIILLSAVLVFHMLILTGIIPYDAVWGGRLKDRRQMIAFEITSIAVNSIMLLTVLIKMEDIRVKVNNRFLNVLLWMIAGIFLLNSFGNLFSLNKFETLVFTPVTLLLTFLFARVAMEKNPEKV